MVLCRAVINIWEGILIENNGHLTQMTDAFFINRQKVRAAEITMLDHRKTFFIPLSE
jgi:hypothetical protein